MAGGRPGPARTPGNVLQLRGSKLADKRSRPQPKPVAPRLSDYDLTPSAAKMWRKLEAELTRLGLLTKVDGFTLAAACETWALMQAAKREMKGRGGHLDPFTTDVAHGKEIRRSPATLVYTTASKEFRAYVQMLGLSPSAREGLDTGPPLGLDESVDDDADDIFDA